MANNGLTEERNGNAFEERFDVISDPRLREALRTFYSIYDREGLIRWWAGLFDPDIGGFYYSNSARDNDGFLPDMESTAQITAKPVQYYKYGIRDFYSEKIKKRIISFYQSKQDPETGLFFHPQFTKEESLSNIMRYTRDQDSAVSVLRWLGSSPLYPTALDRAKEAKVNEQPTPDVTPWEKNPSSVRSYIKGLMAAKSTESWANSLQTQATTFESAGVLPWVLDILDETVNPKEGLWTSGIDSAQNRFFDLRSPAQSESKYGVFTAAFKIMSLYRRGKRDFPYAVRFAENAFETIFSGEPTARITFAFNPWAALGNLRLLLDSVGSSYLPAFDKTVAKYAVDAVKASIIALAPYRIEDGSYSFLPGRSSPTIYGTKVSLGVKEGDVNGNNLAVSFAAHICEVMGLKEPIPVFSDSDWELFKNLLNEKSSHIPD